MGLKEGPGNEVAEHVWCKIRLERWVVSDHACYRIITLFTLRSVETPRSVSNMEIGSVFLISGCNVENELESGGGSAVGMDNLLYLNNYGNKLNPKSHWLNTEKNHLYHVEFSRAWQPSSVVKSIHQGYLVKRRWS